MSKVKWTNEQLNAIKEDRNNVLVAAAAGSGKTAVLVERIINKIINKNVDIDKILVVTFTNAAASEMRERILEAIYKKIEENSNDNRLTRQITLLSKSNICTIDSFCLDVVKNNFYEILIDEYQDTSDIQELLISKISNNNVYVVGDIKQSIYRFRYANPDIFKKKYEDYSKGVGGKKIDLTNNFRSRFEVLRDINLFFNKTMSSSVGGADYTNGHQLVAGNLSYLKDEKDKSEILSYEKQKGIDSAYIEAQLIADDIKQKVHTFQLKDHLCDSYRIQIYF